MTGWEDFYNQAKEAEICYDLTDFYDGGQHGTRYGDKSFILEQIDKLPIRLQPEARKRYSEVFRALSGDPNQRQRANRWLVKLVAKYAAQDTGIPF